MLLSRMFGGKRVPGRGRQILLCVGCLMSFFVSAAHESVGQVPEPSDLDQADSRFFGELSHRRLYDLAADFARMRVDRRQGNESQAFWVDQLATTLRRRTWEESGPDRQALTRQSIESITDYLTSHVVRPETDLALRLNQIESLVNMVRISDVLHDAGHRGPPTKVPRPAPSGIQRYLDESQKLLTALQQQLEANRVRLDRRRRSLLRERANRLAVELDFYHQLSVGPVVSSAAGPPDQNQELRDRVKALMRSARMAETRQYLSLLLADLQLADGDTEALARQLRSRDSSFTLPQRQALQLRLLLHGGQATEALAFLDKIKTRQSDVGSEIAVLRLEALLTLRIQADDLEDSAIKDRCDEQFLRVQIESGVWMPSVWKEAADRVVQRYELVRNVGGEVAALVEHVEALRQQGQYAEALRILKRALRLLPPQATVPSRAAIHLRMGEIFIAQQQWQAAIPLLDRAASLYADADRKGLAATASLLAVYCIGQQWKTHPENNQLQQAYYDRLVAHRNHWKNDSSQKTSTDWLVQLTTQIDPLYAVSLLIELSESSNHRRQRIRRLNQAGEQLQAAHEGSEESRSEDSWQELRQKFLKLCEREGLMEGALTDDSARLLLLVEVLTANAQTKWEHWKKLRQRLADVSTAIVEIDPVALDRLRLLDLVATARTSTDSKLLAKKQQKFLNDATMRPVIAARRLAGFLKSDGLVQPGDGLLATTVERLVSEQVASSASPAQLSELLGLAMLASRDTATTVLRQELLDRLLTQPLTAEQASQVASALIGSGEPASGKASTQLWKLWMRVQKECDEGTDLWLESRLQIARMHAEQGNSDEALKLLRLTAVIYADWGSKDRHGRATELLQKLRRPVQSQ